MEELMKEFGEIILQIQLGINQQFDASPLLQFIEQNFEPKQPAKSCEGCIWGKFCERMIGIREKEKRFSEIVLQKDLDYCSAWEAK